MIVTEDRNIGYLNAQEKTSKFEDFLYNKPLDQGFKNSNRMDTETVDKMSKEEINSEFNKKLMELQESIVILESDRTTSLGTLLQLDMIMLIRNIRDLYGLNKLVFNMLLEFRNNIENLDKNKDGLVSLNQLKITYDHSFEKLQERLKRINARDNEEKIKRVGAG